MSQMNQETALTICDACCRIGQNNQFGEVIAIAEAAKIKTQSLDKTRIAFVTDQARSINRIADEVFHFQAIPAEKEARFASKTAVFEFRYAENDHYADFSAEDLQNHFISEVAVKGLEQIDVSFYLSNGEFTDHSWKEVLQSVDYLFLVVSAGHLLTTAEREFVETTIRKNGAITRFAMVLSDLNMLNSLAALEDIENRIAWFLDSMGANKKYYSLGPEGDLEAAITGELAERSEELRALTFWQIAQMCLTDVENHLKLLLQRAQVNTEELSNQIAVLQSRKTDMIRMGELLATKFSSSLNGRVIHNAIVFTRKYVDQIENSIYSGLQESDLETAAEMVPSYMDAALAKLKSELSSSISNETNLLWDTIEKQMEADAGEFFTGIQELPGGIFNPPIQPTVDNPFASIPDNYSTSGQRNTLQKISKALLIGSVPVLLFGGIPAAAGTIIASQVIKKIPIKPNKTLENLKDEIHGICYDYLMSVEKGLMELGEQTGVYGEQLIRNAYESFVNRVLDSLAKVLKEAEEAKEKAVQLKFILEKELPEIKANL